MRPGHPMLDPKLALSGNLQQPEGADVLARADTIGLNATNDRLAESILFGIWDYMLHAAP